MALDLLDKTANGNNLTNNNGVSDVTISLPFPASSHAAGFAAASSQYLSAADVAAFRITGNFTIETWVKTSTVGTGIFQSYSENTAVSGIAVQVSGAGVAAFFIGRNTGSVSGTDYKLLSGTVNIADGAWHHIACVWDGTTMYIYVDGTLDASIAWANAPAYATTNYVRIGSVNKSGSEVALFNGTIDDIRVWSTNRTVTQISNNKSLELVGNEANLVAYWPLESLSSTSPSASTSPSPSISPSNSSSASLSPSASISPSASSSRSLSPSSSISSSISPSASFSPSASSSPSLSPSSSISASTSPSPSLGYSDYSRTARQVLPSDTNDLNTFYTDNEKTLVAKRDGQYVAIDGALAYMIHQFKNFIGGNSSCAIEWEGKSTLAPEDSTVFLQIFNQQSQVWDTKDVESDAEENQNFELEARLEDLTNYKDQDNVIISRVYQLAI